MLRVRRLPSAQTLCWLPVLLLGWAACTEFRTDPGDLTARGGPAAGVNCAACHAYPLRDTNHIYHLYEPDSNITSDRPITCLNCHDRSLANRRVAYADSIFRDPGGNEFHALDFPDDAELRTFTLVRVDTLIKRRPVPAPERPGPSPEMQEWVTALAHLNGTVDVEFDSTSEDTGRFHGMRAVFNPAEQTCSSVDCHPNHGAYRWGIPSRGLPTLKGDTLPAAVPGALKKPTP